MAPTSTAAKAPASSGVMGGKAPAKKAVKGKPSTAGGDDKKKKKRKTRKET